MSTTAMYVQYDKDTYKITKTAPKNKPGIINYNSSANHKQLTLDGYEYRSVEQGWDGLYIAGHAPEEPITRLQMRKLQELAAAFVSSSEDAHVYSSLGFVIDANEAANRNIDGLIKLLTATAAIAEKDATPATLEFCDYYNKFHTVTLQDLIVMQMEIIKNGAQLYQIKWQYRTAINTAVTKEELDAIHIDFTMATMTSDD